jgi:hypothetical protein
VGRQITIVELRQELIAACGGGPGQAALDVIEKHLINGDRIKANGLQAVVNLPPPDLDGAARFSDFGAYKVGDPDPTPDSPPWCGARYQDPEGGAWCTWRPGHDGPHVSADPRGIIAVFTEVAGWHKYAGLTDDEINAAAAVDVADERDAAPPPSEARPRVESALGGTRLACGAEALRDRVETAARHDKPPSKSELTALMVMVTDLLVAVTEKVEK